MLRMYCTSWCGPVPKLMLFSNGTEMISATGFCVFFARSESSCAPTGGETMRTASSVAPTVCRRPDDVLVADLATFLCPRVAHASDAKLLNAVLVMSVAVPLTGRIVLGRDLHAGMHIGAVTVVSVVKRDHVAAKLTHLIAGRLGSCLRRELIAVIFVAELRGTITRADREICTLAAPVPERELAVEVFGIGWIFVAETVPAFPNPVHVGVMEVEEGVT